MWQILGIIGVLGSVGIGYIWAGGKFGVILSALGPEMTIIGGSAAMTVLIMADGKTLGKVAKGLARAFKGSRWKKDDYGDVICLVFLLLRVARSEGNVVLERHVEKPETSAIFQKYPRISSDPSTVAFIADMVRAMTIGMTDPNKASEIMEVQIERIGHDAMKPAKLLSNVADALPALGIVAAVLGVIKAMGSITESSEVLGRMIGSALVGTFLGVFLSYGLVGPLATRLKTIAEDERSMYEVIREMLVAHLEGMAPQVCVELGRKAVPVAFQPSFTEMEGKMKTATSGMRKSDDAA